MEAYNVLSDGFMYCEFVIIPLFSFFLSRVYGKYCTVLPLESIVVHFFI